MRLGGAWWGEGTGDGGAGGPWGWLLGGGRFGRRGPGGGTGRSGEPGSGEPGSGRPLAARLAACALAAIGAFGAGGGETYAGSYQVLACEAAERPVNNAWRERDHRGMLADASCTRRGGASRGLLVQNRVGPGRVRHGRGAFLTFRAPADTTLRSIGLDWDGRRAATGWRLGLVRSDGRLVAGCRPAPPARAACRLGDPKGARLLRPGLGGARWVRFEASCVARSGCETAPLGESGDRTRARLAVHHAAVEVADPSRPNLAVSGGLLEDGWHRGEGEVSVQAGDNVGVRTTSLRAGAAPLGAESERCDFTRPVPCPRTARGEYPVDTRDLPDGQHELTATALDTAANSRTRTRTLRVDNHAPHEVQAVRVVGGDRVRAVNSFDVRWRPPGGQAAPITRAHYRLCRVGGRGGCVSGVRPGVMHGIDDLAVPARGDWRFTVWLEDAAGNVDPAFDSEPVTLRFDDRVAVRVEAGFAARGGRSESSATVDYGEWPAVAGTLLDARGDRVRGATLALASRVRGTERFRRAGSTATDASGRFRVRLRAGPSRTVRTAFRGSGSHRPAHRDLRLTVRAGSTIGVSRHRVRNGGRVRFEGRLLGRPVPAGGKLLQLEAFYRDRWRTFAVVRSGADGRWSYVYRFEATTGRVRYPFRVRIPSEPGYPYRAGKSRTVSVTVTGR